MKTWKNTNWQTNRFHTAYWNTVGWNWLWRRFWGWILPMQWIKPIKAETQNWSRK